MCRMLTVAGRVGIAQGLRAGWSIRVIAVRVDRSLSVVWREVRGDWLKTRGYRLVHADCAAQVRRRRPQIGKVAADEVLRARVLADLGQSRTRRQIAGRLHLEARDEAVGLMSASPNAEGRTVSHEAIYRFIYALPKGELAKHGVLLGS